MVLAKIILSEKDKALTDNVSLLRGGISMSHAPNSPDLNPEDYNIWLEMWQLVCHRQNFITPKKLKKLNHHMLDMLHGLKQSVINDTFGHQLCVIDNAQLMSVIKCPCACICVTGRHFRHLVCYMWSLCSAFVCLLCEN